MSKGLALTMQSPYNYIQKISRGFFLGKFCKNEYLAKWQNGSVIT